MSIEALKEAKSVISSINASRHHQITIGGEKVFWQREEWVRWALDEVLPVISKAIADATHGNAEDQYIEMSKHLNCPHCGGSGHIDDVAENQEPVAWRNAAIRVGEDLCSVGPFGYYDMTAEQWLDWALSVVTVHANPQPKREPLTEGQINARAKEECAHNADFWAGVRFAEAFHGIKEKNT